VLVVLEIVIDSHPDLGRFSDYVSYLPKIVAGFIGFAAITGQLDSDVAQLGASGVLGGGTAAGVHWLRNKVRQPFRDFAEDTHESAGKVASLSEAGASAALSGTAVVVPPLSMVLAFALVGGSVAVARKAEARRVPCAHCGEPIRPGALVCVHCKREQ
jgi:dihydrodipicolinate synthase/N-acetylneuraminate lyase